MAEPSTQITPATPEVPPVHPGDIIQITDPQHDQFRALLVIQQVRKWGVGANLPTVMHGSLGDVYVRLKRAQFTVCGAAALIPEGVASARRDSVAHARELEKEAARGEG